MTDYGRDLVCVYDLDPMMLEVTDRRIVAQRIARRLTCFRGGCIDAPNDGYDLRDELSRDVDNTTLVQIKARIRSEILKDEAVNSITVGSLTYNQQSQTLNASITLDLGAGPFPLVLNISAVSVSLLEG